MPAAGGGHAPACASGAAVVAGMARSHRKGKAFGFRVGGGNAPDCVSGAAVAAGMARSCRGMFFISGVGGAPQRNWICPLTFTVIVAVPDCTATGGAAASEDIAIIPRSRRNITGSGALPTVTSTTS